jgi:hypothetical protein
MSGELLLKASSARRTALSVAGAVLAAGFVTFLFLRLSPLEEGLARAVLAALLAYVIFRVFYPAIAGVLGRGQAVRTVAWRLEGETLYLGELAIPRASIKMVHCWPDRDALGHQGAGWTVNIETTGKNQVLRTLAEGEDLERSVTGLRELVTALGYGGQWQEP